MVVGARIHTQTHTLLHTFHSHLPITNIYSAAHSLCHSLIHPFVIYPSTQQSHSLTSFAVRQISASHVNSLLLVHLIYSDPFIPLSTPLFFHPLLLGFPLS